MALQDLRDTLANVSTVAKQATKEGLERTKIYAGDLRKLLENELNTRLPARLAPAKEYARALGRSEGAKKAMKLATFGVGGTGVGAFAANQVKKLFQ
jgi:hypothetical protein